MRSATFPALFAAALLAAAPFGAPAARAATVAPAEAGHYAGRKITVEGVANVTTTRSGVVFVDLGGVGRGAPFTGFIAKENAARFPDVGRYSGKTVDITGTVQTFRGRPEIVLTDPGQIAVK